MLPSLRLWKQQRLVMRQQLKQTSRCRRLPSTHYLWMENLTRSVCMITDDREEDRVDVEADRVNVDEDREKDRPRSTVDGEKDRVDDPNTRSH